MTGATCTRCGDVILPGQMYRLVGRYRLVVHIACPTERQIAHARRMGRR
jgi:hypothetical protein